MSIILDEQLAASEIVVPLRKSHKIHRLQDLRAHQRILDDRIPEILSTLKQPTFVTIDRHFWHPRWCSPRYCLLYFALELEQQMQLPGMLRALLRRPEFCTRAGRMGKVVRVGKEFIDFWEFKKQAKKQIRWNGGSRR